MANVVINAKCPCCEANITLYEEMEYVFCPYCGNKTLLKAAVAFNNANAAAVNNSTGAANVVNAQANPQDFVINGGRLVSYTGTNPYVVIPSFVTEIGDNAFRNRSDIISVVLPNILSVIGNCAFFWCTGLTEIALPPTLVRIGAHAFDNCVNLQSISIPGSVFSVDAYAFNGCVGLRQVTIPGTVRSVARSAFVFCTNVVSLACPANALKMFSGCTRLEEYTDTSGRFTCADPIVYNALPKSVLSERLRNERAMVFRMNNGLCRYCGDSFRLGRCRTCGREKDY